MTKFEEKQRELDTAVAALQDKWGKQVIHRLRDSRKAITTLSTGFPALDTAMGTGGLPTGRIAEILGRPSSGLTTIALKMAINAQHFGGLVFFFDHLLTFDSEYAHLIGVKLDQLIVLQPSDFKQSALILSDVIFSGGIKLIIIGADLNSQAAQTWAPTMDKVVSPLGQSETVVLFLTFLPPTHSDALKLNPDGNQTIAHQNSIISHYAAVRIFIQRSNWVIQEGNLEGYQSQLKILKNKLGPSSKLVNLTIPIIQPNSFLIPSP